VIIGVDMDESSVMQMLDYALVTDEQYNSPETWKDFIDPFPIWGGTEE